MARTKNAPGARASKGLEQVRAMAHPLRLRLIELFARQPQTAKQAAQRLGQPPTRLYHHVAILERAGLLRLKETRAVRGATEKYFEIVRGPLIPESGSLEGSTARDHEAIALTLFDRARNEMVRALAAGAADGKQPMIAARAVARLSPADARHVHAELVRVLRSLRRKREERQASPSRRNRRRYALTIAMVPTFDDGGSEPS